MHQFLVNNREELIARCKQKVAQRPKRAATDQQLVHGIPIFLEQLTRTLAAEEKGESAEGTRISGASGGDAVALSEIGLSAAAHGRELLEMGFTVDQVVHDYGDLCQAITELAVERDAPFSVDQFRTLNRCLDNAIADAVTEFSYQRDLSRSMDQAAEVNQRIGFLVHELRNALGTAMLSVSALELTNMPISGATGAVLKRSLGALKKLIDKTIDEVRSAPQATVLREQFLVADLLVDAAATAKLDPNAHLCRFEVTPADPALSVVANRDILSAALGNLLQNAFKFTRPNGTVQLRAVQDGDRVSIEVQDSCGGLPAGSASRMFTPFSQANGDRSGLGLGLSIARKSVEADGGTLSVQDIPGHGCVFTMNLELASASPVALAEP
ncbi:HAMP domain-containing histidine kinase [Ramlibacter ginsenosidimutans]|uniref:histidine kinase n=1 Tax=Ramlibacter ginsenosidimutans TaxID=502333 RepID=A0A934TVU3_9BURK|nr:HAMP domain-containing sensor histidine kinase [Ramlibacter ginsenosidimutans]MBK6008411.1 HAMP domain-containing histidine kinase [Ramlibacter ginsenosidimutans]